MPEPTKEEVLLAEAKKKEEEAALLAKEEAARLAKQTATKLAAGQTAPTAKYDTEDGLPPRFVGGNLEPVNAKK